MDMEIAVREARKDDYETVLRLLSQIAALHREGRPDLFKAGASKYSKEEYFEILKDSDRPVFIAENAETGEVLGYAFCKRLVVEEDSIFKERRTLYLDDLCVDETARGSGIGTKILGFLKEYAGRTGCYNIELNVWECNPKAISFYTENGFETQRRHVEWIVKKN